MILKILIKHSNLDACSEIENYIERNLLNARFVYDLHAADIVISNDSDYLERHKDEDKRFLYIFYNHERVGLPSHITAIAHNKDGLELMISIIKSFKPKTQSSSRAVHQKQNEELFR